MASSLAKIEGWDLQLGLKLWKEYNQCLLKIAEDFPSLHWLDFDENMEQCSKKMEGFCVKHDILFAEDAKNSFRKELKKYDKLHQIKELEIEHLY